MAAIGCLHRQDPIETEPIKNNVKNRNENNRETKKQSSKIQLRNPVENQYPDRENRAKSHNKMRKPEGKTECGKVKWENRNPDDKIKN